jgi:hypothetical protein
MSISRRMFLTGGTLAIAVPALSQTGHEMHSGLYEELRRPGRTGLPEIANQQRVYDSPVPKAASPPLAGAGAVTPPAQRNGLGGCTCRQDASCRRLRRAEGRSALSSGLSPSERLLDHRRASATWCKPCRSRGARRQALRNRRLHGAEPDTPRRVLLVYEPSGDAWTPIAPLPRPCGAIACVALNDRLHAVGGTEGSTERRSVNWHLAYDPAAERWEHRAPFPTGRDHMGVVAVGGRIHLIGGRGDTFYTNSNLHHAYDPAADKWDMRAPVSTARSGHGAVLYRGKIFVMGG